jgi:hypothetical protein
VSTTAVTTTPTTTTPTTTTPSTIAVRPPAELIAAFVDDYVAAIESGDVDFLLDRLHPAVLDQFDTELCRTFIEREILALRNYRLTGDIEGPTPESIGGRDFESYSAPIAFDFQGESFDGGASWGLVDGEVRWFTTCR